MSVAASDPETALTVAAADAAIATASRQLADVFDNDALWDADDTDEYILKLVGDLEPLLMMPITAMKDQGGNTLLHMAAIWNHGKVLEALVRGGIDLNVKNANGQSPLDLAMHYGNADIGLQIRFYGGKHTCESERDLAIAQRDLAQQQMQDCDAELQDVLQRLKDVRKEREEFRVERDRLAIANTALHSDCDALAADKRVLIQSVAELMGQKEELVLQVMRMKEELTCEQESRQNAVQSWQLARQVVTELQEREVLFQAREDEVLRTRDEAIQDRDVARDLARRAQLDQGLAKKSQLEAERERDRSLKRQLDVENTIAREMEECAKKVAVAEVERKNIQIEIDRQTAVLRAACDNLERQLRKATTLAEKQRDEIAVSRTRAEQFQSQLLEESNKTRQLERAVQERDERVNGLVTEQRSAQSTWKHQLAETLRAEVVHEFHRTLSAIVGVWESLRGSHLEFLAFENWTRSDLLKPTLTTSLTSENRTSSLNRPTTTPTIHMSSPKLPLLLDRSVATTAATPLMSSVSVPNFPDTATTVDVEEDSTRVHFPALTLDIEGKLTAAKDALRLAKDHISAAIVADHVGLFCETLQQYLTALTQYVTKNLRHIRAQVHAMEKMVERKDELIRRFNHHRTEQKKKKSPAKLRSCAYKPLL